MATIFSKENLVISDSKKAEEIANALKQSRDKTVKSVQPPEVAGRRGENMVQALREIIELFQMYRVI